MLFSLNIMQKFALKECLKNEFICFWQIDLYKISKGMNSVAKKYTHKRIGLQVIKKGHF